MAIPSAQDILAVMSTKGELGLRVLPSAKLERAAIENGALKLWARTAPAGGKATKAVLMQVVALLGVPVRNVVLVSGATSREKRVRVRVGA